MNEIDLIKQQIKKLKEISDSKNPAIVEHISQIKKTYLITEEETPRSFERYNVPNSTEQEIEDNEGLTDDVSQGYRVSGGLIMLHGDDSQDVKLTTDEKIAFQETMDEFVNEVSDMVNFGQLNVYKNNVDWSGLIVDSDTEFYFTIGESNGIYMSGEMLKVDQNFLDMVSKLKNL